MGKNDERREVSVMGILDKIFGKEPKIDSILTDDERELRDYEENVYMAESGVAAGNYAEFVIDEAFFIPHKGTVVTGTVTAGVFSTGNDIAIYRGDSLILETSIEAVEQFRNVCHKLSEGARGGIYLKDIDSTMKKQIKRNDIIKKV